MKRIQTIAGWAAMGMVACAVTAQELPKISPEGAGSFTGSSVQVLRASDLLGKEVKNFQDELLGSVKELAIHLETGAIGEVLLSPGYFGTDQTCVGVASAVLHYDSAAKVLRLDSNREKLRLEPRFENWRWIPFSQSNQMDMPYRYQGGVVFNKPELVVPRYLRHLVDEEPATVAALEDIERVPAPNWAAHLGYFHRSRELMGTMVKTHQNEAVGKIDNLVVDLAAGRVVAVIVSTGNFMGMTDEMSPVPVQALLDQRTGGPQFRPASERLVVLNTTRRELEQSPHFSADKWPDFAQRAYIETIYRAYRVKSYAGLEIRFAAGE